MAASIRPAAFRYDPASGPFTADFHALAFPSAWRKIILDLYRLDKRNPDRIKSVPIRRLNETIRAVAPDLLSTAKQATLDDSSPWLYTTRPLEPKILNTLVAAWLADLQRKESMFPHVQAAWAAMDPGALQWKEVAVDLLEQTLSDGGTARPAARLHRLLPDVLAARIETYGRTHPYEDEGVELNFRRVATDRGAELMSWPAHPHIDEDGTTWWFSAFIRITLQTEPFSDVPRIHLHTGVRRWLHHKPVYFPSGHGVTAYLLTPGPWLTGAPQTARIATASMAYDRSLRQVEWKRGGPNGMLEQLSFARDFPAADQLRKEPGRWFNGENGVTAAVVYHTMMGSHAVGAGFMPRDREPLTEWAAKVLAPNVVMLGDASRSKLPALPQKPSVAARKVSMPRDATAEEKVAVKAAKAQAVQEAAQLRRPMVASVLGADTLNVDLYWQTDVMREELINAAVTDLGLLGQERTTGSTELREWTSPELELRIHLHPLGGLGGPLGNGTVPHGRADIDAAIADRRAAARDHATKAGSNARLTLIELDKRKAFTPAHCDPKYALRLGFADAGRVSQFVVRARGTDLKTASHRAQAAWGDGLRQLGMRIVPAHSLGSRLPDGLSQVAFWAVKRRADGPTGKPLFMPIAVMIRPQENRILGRSPETGDWVPYPQLLLQLAGHGQQDRLSEQAKRSMYGMFVKQVLADLRYEPALILTHAHNSRLDWPGLQDGLMIRDHVQFGDARPEKLSAYGKQLRFARLRTSEGYETTQWWKPKSRGDEPGLAAGLWIPAGAGDDNRVFGSTAPKAGPFKSTAVTASRYVPRINAQGAETLDTEVPAWNPANLEITMAGCQDGDDPEAWAMFIHQQRFASDYADALALPLALHLAKRAEDYALPSEEPDVIKLDEDTEATDEIADEPEATVYETLVQYELEFGHDDE